MPRSPSIPVIDLFAGPGGLGEGFSAYRTVHGDQPFRVALSIEKDTQAHSTLRLRSFVRQFGDDIPKEYYAFLADTETPLNRRIESLFDKYPAEAEAARNEAWLAELGAESRATVQERIATALGDADPWVLIGGPPCQAYSLAGRSRNKGNADYVAEEDGRQFLYVEYLQVIADHQPAVFVMENVKGLLSATLKNQRIFDQIVTDLTDPTTALRREGRAARCRGAGAPGAHYAIFSLTERGIFDEGELQDFVVRMEDYGIPQARHRLILLGIRKDICGSHRPGTLQKLPRIAVRDVLDGLPRIRSGLSRTADCADRWLAEVARAATRKWFEQADEDVREQLSRAVDNLRAPIKDRGGEFVQYTPSVRCHEAWYLDERLAGVCNHATRGHIVPDLHRYLFAACFSLARKRSPTLGDFPRALLPKHSNVRDALNGSNFADRFRVQRGDRHATTVTSHIAKDGHYYIHYDPTQCRSLTVREAARLQTFPDNYFFCGPRTAQYAQVGNAVPPLLSRGIAQIVLQLLVDTGAA